MKLFEFVGAETDWIAANDEAEARRALIVHYGIDQDDINASYDEISEVDPAKVEFYTEEVDAETEEEKMTTAAEMMAGKTKPFLVGSTCQ